ncbi:dihydroxyacetone kinase subunit DhaL [Bacillota bacterium Meth-B3]
MTGFCEKDGKDIVSSMIRVIQENKAYLSDIDGLIGDGDHGVNMNKGFTLCEARIAGAEMGLSEALKTLGRVLMMEIGGSMGPLYGTMFAEMARACKRTDRIDRAVFGSMLAAALAGLAELGGAQVGDKTLMDVLVPAETAYREALAEDRDFADCLTAMQTAAEAGWLSTKDMVARIGRASRLGERSRGVLDAGATSCHLLLTAMADGIRTHLDDN